MSDILLISTRVDKIEQYKKLLSQYNVDVKSDENFITDLVNIPDVIIFDSKFPNVKNAIKTLKSITSSTAFILMLDDNCIEPELVKNVNAIITKDMSDELILSVISINLKTKSTLEQLSATNKNLGDSLYRLNVLYGTSSQFAGTLDKDLLINYMIEGLDKSLSFDLTCTLIFDGDFQPTLLLNSLYEISDELLSAIKLRMVLNYKSLFEDAKLPFELDIDNIKVVKNVKYPANRFTFNLFRFDNMFAPISLGDNFYGCIEIYKEASFSADDATCFQTIVQQVSLPLKSASLYKKIIETNEELRRLQHVKSEFISIVSHELRTPLTAIKNALKILESGKCAEYNDDGRKFMLMAQHNADRLALIINDLLDLSKIEAGKMEYHFENIDIHQVISSVISSLSALAKENGLNLIAEETENLPNIIADSKRLEQVLTNLVSNAIKFTPEGKNIIIRSHVADAEQLSPNELFKEDLKKLKGSYIVVCVEDQGIGIAEKDLLRVFDKFAQIENSLSRKVGGSGLGLPIAKRMLEAHNGAIWCDSEFSKGSKFYFAVPVAKSGVLVTN